MRGVYLGGLFGILAYITPFWVKVRHSRLHYVILA